MPMRHLIKHNSEENKNSGNKLMSACVHRTHMVCHRTMEVPLVCLYANVFRNEHARHHIKHLDCIRSVGIFLGHVHASWERRHRRRRRPTTTVATVTTMKIYMRLWPEVAVPAMHVPSSISCVCVLKPRRINRIRWGFYALCSQTWRLSHYYIWAALLLLSFFVVWVHVRFFCVGFVWFGRGRDCGFGWFGVS